jgi:two-component sensor histidine kinase
VEVAASYVVSEALTNAAKHAHASVVHIDLRDHNPQPCRCGHSLLIDLPVDPEGG